MTAATDLTTECAQGFASDPDLSRNPYYWSSDSWLAWEAGAALSAHHVPTQTHRMLANEPAECAKSRGYSVRIKTRGGACYLYSVTGRDLDKREMRRT